MLWSLTDELFAAEGDGLVEALYAYHFCVVTMAGNTIYKLIFQSFQNTIKNLIALHYSDLSERKRNLPLYETMTRLLCERREEEAQQQMEKILTRASQYLLEHSQSTKEKEETAAT